MSKELGHYRARAARALVLLHDRHLRRCVAVWRQARAADLKLPETTDENYHSLATLLVHILGSPRGYLGWVCRNLELPDPNIEPVPTPDVIEAEADRYLEHLLARWALPLADVEEDKLYTPEYPSNGGTHHHCIDIMLQHAVMHPIRHTFQLEELLAQQSQNP